ncbi:unnamed protein product [Prorocentrum cordatum]|uniref:Uncharacterized protein n=1 Tax=Prorocentrum cordatum TaxID=2364126 RepID=A0ABN9UVH7_9DINO|nr:unnamed protein product [Polarella glacialis]
MWKYERSDIVEEREKSKGLVKRTLEEVGEQSRRWLTGILLESWAQVSPQPDLGEELREQLGEFGYMDKEAWFLAADVASGRERAQDPLPRRIAWGWIVLESEGVGPILVAVGRGGLAGWRQSVNQGELMAFKKLLINAKGFQRLRYIAASIYAVRGVAKVKTGKEIVGKQMEAIEVENHMSEAEGISSSTSVLNYVGNELADGCVEDIAEQVQVSEAQARAVRWSEGIAAQIRKGGSGNARGGGRSGTVTTAIKRGQAGSQGQ